MTEVFDIAFKLIGALGLASIIVALIGKKVTTRLSPVEVYERERLIYRENQGDMREEMDDVKRDLRLLTDYVHQLREDFATATGRAPRAWPEGLSQ